jgi:serine protease AprX
MIDAPFATMERTGLAIGATLARSQYGVTGKGIGVAIIDSGITNYHDDLNRSLSGNSSRRVVHFKDFTRHFSANLWFNEIQSDDYGHGTHVAGIIAGSGYDSGGRRTGVAPGAKLLGLKVLDEEGHGYVSDVIAAIDYAISVRSTYNVRVINLSVASGVSVVLERPLTLAAKRAAEAGIIVAAGRQSRLTECVRNGAASITGNAPWVLTVGASTIKARSIGRRHRRQLQFTGRRGWTLPPSPTSSLRASASSRCPIRVAPCTGSWDGTSSRERFRLATNPI